jgi:uncharacterized membrane protein
MQERKMIYQGSKQKLATSVTWLTVALGFASPLLAAPPSYTLNPILLDPAAGTVAVSDINDAGQMAVTVIDPDTYGSTSLRLNPDGTLVACGPVGFQAYRILSDGRILSDATEPGGQIGWTVGNDKGYAYLTRPVGTSSSEPISVGASDAAGTVYGSIGPILATWSGQSLVPKLLGECQNQPTGAQGVSRNGEYIVGSFGTNDGNSEDPGVTQPFSYSNGTFTPIDIPGYTNAVATGVNNDGTVVGYALGSAQGGRLGWMWKGGQLTVLADPYGTDDASPSSINDNGLIVGSDGLHALLWDIDGTGYLIDDLCNAAAMEDGVGFAYAINDSNQIIGDGGGNAYPGQTVPFLLNPIAVPEPTSAAILLTAFPLLAARRRK